MLGVSRSHICDIEKGRKVVSPERAAKWANVLGYSDIGRVRWRGHAACSFRTRKTRNASASGRD